MAIPAPIPQTPLQLPPMAAPPVPVAPNPGTYGAPLPTATPMGAFSGPDPSTVFSQDPYQWRFNQGIQAQQRGAASRGTLLTGGTAKALQDYGQGAASQEYGNAFNRALQTYGANRDTNAQNFGQLLGSYNAGLGAYRANADTALASGRLGLDTYGDQYGAARTAYEDQAGNLARLNDAGNYNANVTNARVFAGAEQSRDDYARALASTQAQNASQTAFNLRQQSGLPRPWDASMNGAAYPHGWLPVGTGR